MKAGIYELGADAYHCDDIGATPTLSASIAKLLVTVTPAHAKAAHPKLNGGVERVAEERFELGTAVHSLMLEGIESVCVVPYDDWRTAAAKEMREIARADGMTPLLAKQWDEVQVMAAAVQSQLGAHHAEPPLFAAGKPEQTLVWEDSGVLCRARVDWLHDDYTAVDDLKTTSRSANPEQWTRTTMFSIGADLQACMYARGVKALTGIEPAFRFVIAETTPPYAISVVSPGPDVMALAEKKVDAALKLWQRCLETDRWPGYEARVAFAELPPWEESRWLEREMREVAA